MTGSHPLIRRGRLLAGFGSGKKKANRVRAGFFGLRLPS